MTFITNLAWILSILSGLLLIMRFIGYMTYSELDKISDDLNGIERSFPMMTPLIICVISVCWIISN